MKSVNETIASPWKGSEQTAEMVREQVLERFGPDAAEAFDPATDAMPLVSWARYGFKVKKGAKSLKSITYVIVADDEGNIEKKIRRTVHLFHKRDVEKRA